LFGTQRTLEMDRMSDYDIRPKPEGSPNECRTFGRTRPNVVGYYERLLQATGECTEWPGNVIVSIK